jgi:AcrR family transcriptional regulator
MAGVVAESGVSLRERTRRAVQAEVAEVAMRLFVEQGYDATTIDQIAAAAGMSKRSVFRYFATKEDVVCGKYELVGEQLAAELRKRPLDEPLWESLRRIFDGLLPYVDDANNRAFAVSIERIVQVTPALRARYLEKVDHMEALCEQVVRDRLAELGRPSADGDPRPRAVVGAAFSCLLAAQSAAVAEWNRRSFADLLDEAMASMSPAPL